MTQWWNRQHGYRPIIEGPRIPPTSQHIPPSQKQYCATMTRDELAKLLSERDAAADMIAVPDSAYFLALADTAIAALTRESGSVTIPRPTVATHVPPDNCLHLYYADDAAFEAAMKELPDAR
jgi:hypothetical protein